MTIRNQKASKLAYIHRKLAYTPRLEHFLLGSRKFSLWKQWEIWVEMRERALASKYKQNEGLAWYRTVDILSLQKRAKFVHWATAYKEAHVTSQSAGSLCTGQMRTKRHMSLSFHFGDLFKIAKTRSLRPLITAQCMAFRSSSCNTFLCQQSLFSITRRDIHTLKQSTRYYECTILNSSILVTESLWFASSIALASWRILHKRQRRIIFTHLPNVSELLQGKNCTEAFWHAEVTYNS